MTQQATDIFNSIMFGGTLTPVICAIAELGIADLVPPDGSKTIAELAIDTRTDESALYRAMRFLVANKIFKTSESLPRSFEHTPLSIALREDAEGSYRAAALMTGILLPALEYVSNSLRTGEPAFDMAFGMPLFKYLEQNPKIATIFNAAMKSIHGYEKRAGVDAYDFKDIHLLADVGGGDGSLITTVLNRYNDMQGIIFDRQHATAQAEESIKRSGLGQRCHFVAGDFFGPISLGSSQPDGIVLSHILHDWQDEKCVQILTHCRDALNPQGRLLVIENVLSSQNRNVIGTAFDIQMLLYPGGLERTEEEFRSLFRKAGFALRSVTPTKAPLASVIEARPLILT